MYMKTRAMMYKDEQVCLVLYDEVHLWCAQYNMVHSSGVDVLLVLVIATLQGVKRKHYTELQLRCTVICMDRLTSSLVTANYGRWNYFKIGDVGGIWKDATMDFILEENMEEDERTHRWYCWRWRRVWSRFGSTDGKSVEWREMSE